MKYPNKIEYQVYGKYAMFSEPVNRIGGEKLTYQIPTYQALKDITESIFLMPSITWLIDDVRVMTPIKTEAKSIRPISYNSAKNTLSVYTYLVDVVYQVRAHFVFNERRLLELGEEPNEHEYYIMVKRMVEKGGQRDIFLGARECQAYVEPCVFGEGMGYYDCRGSIKFDLMFHGFDYPDEAGRDMFVAHFWYPAMTNGVIHFPAQILRDIQPMKVKAFGGTRENCRGLEEDSIQEELGNAGNQINVVDAETVLGI